MKVSEVKRFATLYNCHLRLLKLQGKSKSTIDAYSRAVRRIKDHYDCCPDKLTREQLENYFGDLVESHSWSTVKIGRLGLMCFWKHVLEKDWQWLNIIQPPAVKTIPDILIREEIALLIHATRKLRYRVFLFTTYSMGLRLQETLSLQTSDIDAGRRRVHIRRGKGHKDRLVPLPNRTLKALRILWRDHRHPKLLFPNYKGSAQTIIRADSHMNIGSTQQAMKAVVTACNIKKSLNTLPQAQLRHAFTGSWFKPSPHPEEQGNQRAPPIPKENIIERVEVVSCDDGWPGFEEKVLEVLKKFKTTKGYVRPK